MRIYDRMDVDHANDVRSEEDSSHPSLADYNKFLLA